MMVMLGVVFGKFDEVVEYLLCVLEFDLEGVFVMLMCFNCVLVCV